MKMRLRQLLLSFLSLFSSEISDCNTGKKLGRGLVIAWGNRIFLLGYQGRPLVPKFLPQQRLTYWRQDIGFVTQDLPDFPRILPLEKTEVGKPGRVLNLLLTHQAGDSFKRLRELWTPVCTDENLWVAFGGKQEDFEKLDYPRKVFVEDARLRTRDHQREKQSYTGIFRAMAPVVEQEKPDYIYLCEYDQIPLVPNLNELQVAEMEGEGADVMGHVLDRIDHTSHAHALFQDAESAFPPFLVSLTKRENSSVVLTMFGSGSMWRTEAFLAVAKKDESVMCYLELYLPTLAHHLGFRVRGWNESRHLISNLPDKDISVQEGLRRGCWTVHPVKDC